MPVYISWHRMCVERPSSEPIRTISRTAEGRDRAHIPRRCSLDDTGWRSVISSSGEIEDVLVDREGKATALIIGVGGFLGIGAKDVAVPFNSVRVTTKDNDKWYLVMNATKDGLKSSKGFKYDRSNMTWMPEDANTTTGSPPPRNR
jgi:hypothetical protein